MRTKSPRRNRRVPFKNLDFVRPLGEKFPRKLGREFLHRFIPACKICAQLPA